MSMQRTLWFGYFLVMVLAVFFVTDSAEEEKTVSLKELEQVWSLEGTWTGVACDESKGVIYVLGTRGKCREVDLKGKTQREIKLPEDSGTALRLADLASEKGMALLTFGVWGAKLSVYELNGKQLWSYPSAAGINDIQAIDLNGDKVDEVIVGYNGGTGLHVLNSKGQLLWKSTAIGNVWHVDAGDVLGEGTLQVVTTSAVGKVHIFGSDGKKRKDMDVGFYANMVRVGKVYQKDKNTTILVAGSALGDGAKQKTEIISAFSGDGTRKWSLELPAGTPPYVDSASLASEKTWLAVGMRGGQVHVVDVEKGQIIATVNDQGVRPEVGWAAGKDVGAPLLLVATGSKLNAFRVTKSK